jgi:hypothetical protein
MSRMSDLNSVAQEHGIDTSAPDALAQAVAADREDEGGVTRAEHLAWCKTRALAYVDARDLPNAFASLVSDLRKHPETEGHEAMTLGMVLLFAGRLDTAKDMRDFIEGCN